MAICHELPEQTEIGGAWLASQQKCLFQTLSQRLVNISFEPWSHLHEPLLLLFKRLGSCLWHQPEVLMHSVNHLEVVSKMLFTTRSIIL